MQSQFLRVVTGIMVPGEWFVAGEILLGVEFLQQRPLRLYLQVHFFFAPFILIWILCFASCF
jgi:hypothetical protein